MNARMLLLVWVALAWRLALIAGVAGGRWTHSAALDNDGNFILFWTPGDDDITFEVHVRTLGYVGFGFSSNGQMAGSDMVIGWVQDGQAYLEDRHAKDRSEPEVEASQDWELLLGYENGTHTILRFRRAYDTCDRMDYKITNDTMRVIYAYHDEDPVDGSGLLYHGSSRRGSRSLYLVERVNQDSLLHTEGLRHWDLRNPSVLLPATEDTLYWCKIFKLPEIKRRHHMVRYEPLHQQGNHQYMHHVILYECQGNDPQFERYAQHQGQVCYQPNQPAVFFNCNNVVAAWVIGSEGFTFPVDAGYPLDPHSGPLYYMMETHYNNPSQDSGVLDSSGIRIYHTPILRRHDAGVLSVGLDPNWKHIIPPGQPAVISEGHCIGDCTRHAIPPNGINIFAVNLHTHLIGRKIKFRLIRGGEEHPPITVDNNYDFNYQEYRKLRSPVKVYPGDHLIAECVYNSMDRSTITLGGLTTREEMCLVFALYYPRMELSMCYSLPSLPTVLHSLGIQELWPGSSPVKIKSPPELADMTLENRLVTYDWENNFDSFQETTRRGSFKPLCWMKKPKTVIPGTEDFEAYYPNITKPYKEPPSCQGKKKKPLRKRKPGEEEDGDEERNYVVGEERDRAKVYFGVQESSKLNRSGSAAIGPLHWVLLAFSLALVPLSR
ncbi:MOXD1 homolog 2 [Hetaerina americana]|uniref:MOXD1 homolog 2 n=1 Tax=Hetaerina americana TaxID=62018 RepID=UPI003A7F4E39